MDEPTQQEINQAIAKRLREGRENKGMSQMALAEAMDISFQQLQKYERAENRISAPRLFVLARTLDLPVNWFFELCLEQKRD